MIQANFLPKLTFLTYDEEGIVRAMSDKLGTLAAWESHITGRGIVVYSYKTENNIGVLEVLIADSADLSAIEGITVHGSMRDRAALSVTDRRRFEEEMLTLG